MFKLVVKYRHFQEADLQGPTQGRFAGHDAPKLIPEPELLLRSRSYWAATRVYTLHTCGILCVHTADLSDRQDFFAQHDAPVVALALAADASYVASGQARRPTQNTAAS